MDVILVVADALRADALATIRPDGQALHLTRRFRSWLRYDRYFTAAPWTLPAVTSMFSGTNAATHEHYSNQTPL